MIANGILATKPGDVLFFIDAAGMAGHASLVTETYANEVVVRQHSSPQNRDRKLSQWLMDIFDVKSLAAGKNLDTLIRENLKQHPKLRVEAHNINDAIPQSVFNVPLPAPGPTPSN